MAKWLSWAGWQVTVVTPEPSLWQVADATEPALRSSMEAGVTFLNTQHRWRLAAPDFVQRPEAPLLRIAGRVIRVCARVLDIDLAFGWVRDVEDVCRNLKPEDVDVVLTTGMPFISFTIAQRLAKRLGRPYVLDYLDPWTSAPHLKRQKRWYVRAQERKLAAGAAALTIVSDSWKTLLARQLGLTVPIHVVSNGYDPGQLAEIPPVRFDHFAVLYAGVLYPPKRVLSPLMAALKVLETLAPDPDRWAFHYYGPQADMVRREADGNNITHRVHIHGQAPRDQVLAATRGAGVVVVITSVSDACDLGEAGIITGKIFETIGLGVPILLIAPQGSDAEAVAEESGLARRFSGEEAEAMGHYLFSLMDGHRPHALRPETYSWPNIAMQLDRILRAAAARGRPADTSGAVERDS